MLLSGCQVMGAKPVGVGPLTSAFPDHVFISWAANVILLILISF